MIGPPRARAVARGAGSTGSSTRCGTPTAGWTSATGSSAKRYLAPPRPALACLPRRVLGLAAAPPPPAPAPPASRPGHARPHALPTFPWPPARAPRRPPAPLTHGGRAVPAARQPALAQVPLLQLPHPAPRRRPRPRQAERQERRGLLAPPRIRITAASRAGCAAGAGLALSWAGPRRAPRDAWRLAARSQTCSLVPTAVSRCVSLRGCMLWAYGGGAAAVAGGSRAENCRQ